MWRLRFRFLLFLAIIGLLGGGVYLQYLEDPTQTPLPEQLRGPFDRMKALLGEGGSSLQSDIDALASEIEIHLRAYDDAAPEGYKRLMGHVDIPDEPAPENNEGIEPKAAPSEYSTPAEALPQIKKDLETMLDQIDFSQAPELRKKAADLYERVSANIKENASDLKDAAID